MIAQERCTLAAMVDAYEDDKLEAIRGLGWTKKAGEGDAGFTKGEDCFECVRDIQRYLRRDPPTRPFHLRLAQLRVLPMRLLPLVAGGAAAGDKRLQLAVIKLLVTMTMPLSDEFDESTRPAHEAYLRSYVRDFLQKDAIAVFVLLLEPALGREDPTQRSREENMLLELVLTLFRNLLLVESTDVKMSGSTGRESETRVHEDLVMMMVRLNYAALAPRSRSPAVALPACAPRRAVASLVRAAHPRSLAPSPPPVCSRSTRKTSSASCSSSRSRSRWLVTRSGTCLSSR